MDYVQNPDENKSFFNWKQWQGKCLLWKSKASPQEITEGIQLSINTYRNAKLTLPGKSLKYVLKTDDHDDCGWQLKDILMICKDNHSKRMNIPLIALRATVVTWLFLWRTEQNKTLLNLHPNKCLTPWPRMEINNNHNSYLKHLQNESHYFKA